MKVVDVRAGFAHAQIVVGDSLTIVDPGAARPVLAALARESLRATDVRHIVITHGDPDHWRGVAPLRELSGAEVLAHTDERAYLEGQAPPFRLPKRLLLRVGPRPTPPRIDRWLQDGDRVDGLTVVHAPGHTPGHICLIAGAALIAADAFTTGPQFREVPHVMTSDLAVSRRSIRSLALRGASRAFSGHGEPSDDAAEKLRALASRLP